MVAALLLLLVEMATEQVLVVSGEEVEKEVLAAVGAVVVIVDSPIMIVNLCQFVVFRYSLIQFSVWRQDIHANQADHF